MANTISWQFSGSQKIDEETFEDLEFEEIDELTYSKVYIPCDFQNGKLTIKLFNTDPKNWNLFMFPYDTNKIRKPISIDEVVRNSNSEKQFFENFGIPFDVSEQRSIPTECEIKMSQSSGKRTLYVFQYKACALNGYNMDAESQILEFRNRDDIRMEFESKPKTYASNVLNAVLELWDELL